jgi:FkbM family methyltransferase
MNTHVGFQINKIANRFGLEIHRYLPQKRAGSLRSMFDVCNQAKNCGLKINTVFDVGVADGTQELYDSFPEATFVLVEPLQEFDHSIDLIARKYSTIRIRAAASDRCGKTNIFIDQKSFHGTSLFENRGSNNLSNTKREVELVTLDAIYSAHKLNGPFLIKADVQGAELNVIQGASVLLNHTEMVILETSLYEFMVGAPQIHDVIFAMKGYGFAVYDFIGGAIRPFDGALGQIDIAFVKEDGVLRRSHQYA